MSKTEVSIYLACRMSGLTGNQIWDNYEKIAPIYFSHGITVVSPIFGEGIERNNEPLPDRSDEEGITIWKNKDKQQIRDAHVCVYPDISQGILHEYGYSRYALWKPSVFVLSNPGFISRAEDDLAVRTHDEAAELIVENWGTREKRIVWRMAMLKRSLPKWVENQIGEFK